MTSLPNIIKHDFARDEFLSRFAANLPAFASDLGLSPRDIATVQNDAVVFQWAMDAHAQYRAFTRDWMVYKRRLRDGVDSSDEAGVEIPRRPPMSALPSGNPVPGIFRRLGRLIEQIKGFPAYTPAMGEALGMTECEWMIDAAWARPYIKVRRVGQAHPEIVWEKFQYDGLLLEVDRDGSGFVFLAVDTVPNFIDTHPVPPVGSDAVWKYRAIYEVGDEPAGRWSDTVRLSFPAPR